MDNNLKWIVYCTTNTINKKIYIGVHMTNNPNVFDGYLGNGVYVNKPSTYEHGKNVFHLAVKKYGPSNFIRNTIAVFNNEEDAFLLESELVNEDFLKRTDVYNIALGGKSGGQITQRIKIYQYSETGEFIKEHESILKASLIVNRNLSSIQRALKNKYKCANYYWCYTKYDKLDLSKMYQCEGHKCIPVFQYDLNGNYECCYNSIADAARILKVNDSNLTIAIKTGGICNKKHFTIVYMPEYSQARNEYLISREVHQYGLDGKYINSYENMNKAKKALNIKSDIYKAIKLKRTAGNYQWSFEKLDQIAPVEIKTGKAKHVGKFDKNWNLIEVYKSLSECKKINGSGMVHVIQGRDEFAKGFRYKYINQVKDIV